MKPIFEQTQREKINNMIDEYEDSYPPLKALELSPEEWRNFVAETQAKFPSSSLREHFTVAYYRGIALRKEA